MQSRRLPHAVATAPLPPPLPTNPVATVAMPRRSVDKSTRAPPSSLSPPQPLPAPGNPNPNPKSSRDRRSPLSRPPATQAAPSSPELSLRATAASSTSQGSQPVLGGPQLAGIVAVPPLWPRLCRASSRRLRPRRPLPWVPGELLLLLAFLSLPNSLSNCGRIVDLSLPPPQLAAGESPAT